MTAVDARHDVVGTRGVNAVAKWSKKVLRLPENHGWRSKPGYKIFVADRGAVRFDVPREWVVVPEEKTVKFYDKAPPNDDCRLELSVMYLNPQIDWTGLPLVQLFAEATKKGELETLQEGELVYVQRPDLELVWRENRVLDPGENREALSRACLARGSNVLPLITLDFWPEDAERVVPAWDEVLRSLQLGNYIKDVTRRDLH
jgi:hypothetical protein